MSDADLEILRTCTSSSLRGRGSRSKPTSVWDVDGFEAESLVLFLQGKKYVSVAQYIFYDMDFENMPISPYDCDIVFEHRCYL